jgi:threonine aldolase
MSWLRSDSIAGVPQEILDALQACNGGVALPYGEDTLSRRLDERFSAVFGAPVRVFPVTSGTAANALALASLAGAFDLIACHADAHSFASETGATELLSGGARFLHLPGTHGRIDPFAAATRIDDALRGGDKAYRLAALTVTQLTEAGTAYRPQALRALGELARGHGLRLHVDGARFANAVAALDVDPAELSWRAGAHALSFGATKNGTMCADAVVFFDADLVGDVPRRRKRTGQDLSKTRFLAAQLLAYLENDLWLRNARHANAMARRLADAVEASADLALLHPVEGNMLFVATTQDRLESLARAGLPLRVRSSLPDGRRVCRLVTSFATTHEEVRRFAAVVAAH